MKMCAAQLRSVPGDVEANLERHVSAIAKAQALGVDFMMFPELSLTGYVPGQALELALDPCDSRLARFSEASNDSGIITGVGFPCRTDTGVQISLLFSRPGEEPLLYSKQWLHRDEMPFFTPGTEQLILSMGHLRMAPAICYESLQAEHAAAAAARNANVYLASVAKSERDVSRAYSQYSEIARRYAMTVLMVNTLGPCGDFMAAGRSAAWNNRGDLVGNADSMSESLVVFDINMSQVSLVLLPT